MTGPPDAISSGETDAGDDRTLHLGELTRRQVIRSGAAAGAAGMLGSGNAVAQTDHDHPEEINVLVFSATAGWRHQNIEYGNQALLDLDDDIAAATNAHEVTIDLIDEDGTNHDFPDSAAELEQYDVIVWNNTTGSVLDHGQQQAFEEYMRNGGGFAGIHAAGDTHEHWNFYVEEVVGANFEAHPPVQEAEIAVTDGVHPSTRHLPDRWEVTDEWYDYDRNPRGDVHVLATLDEDSYDGATQHGGREDHPIAWCKEVDDGRAWYTGRGHTEGAWDEDAFVEHVLQGILWAGEFVEGDATATVWDSYNQVNLTRDVTGPVSVEVSPDGTVYVVDIEANVRAIDPDTGATSIALDRQFYHEVESGGHDLAFDPDFEDNRYVYFYYSPTENDLDPGADQPYSVISRFEVDESTGEFDESTETEILRVPTQRRTDVGIWNGSDYHLAGGLEFGPEGNLHLSTGDNVTPHDHDGFPPMEEGTYPNWMDARGTSADTSDLRGKILRIEPHEDGSYSVPEDNMFTEANGYGAEIDAGTVAPEVFAMGFRNPFRFGIDDDTGDLYVADMGPDSREWDTDRGPLGIRTYNRISEPANFGWPMVRLDYPYYDFDYSTYQTGQLFDPDGPTNDSEHNDGLTQLPPVDTDQTLAYVATDWETYLNEPHGGPWNTPDQVPHPELEDTGVIGGPVFNFDAVGDGGLPYYFEGKWLIGGWNAGTLKLISTDEDGDLLEIEPFLPGLDLESPNDMAVGPDGRLFVADWGEGLDGINPGVYRIDHEPDVVAPQYEETFELEGAIGGWTGVSPASIADETNPDLPVEIGETYRVEWTNVDGTPHNFAIRNEDGDALLSTDLVSDQGATQTVEFTMTEEMDHYVCEPHVSSMRGGLADGSIDTGNLGTPAEELTVEMQSGNAFEPIVAHVEVGGTVTWEYVSGFPHNAVAYHPDTHGTEQRIPYGGDPWETDLLSSPGESYDVTFDEPGVYDYVCTPHEEAGMVGTIVVGWPDPDGEPGLSPVSSSLPDGAVNVLELLNEAVREGLEAGAHPCVENGAAGIEELSNGEIVCDLDGDGNYRDVTGSGETTIQDLQHFFGNQHQDPWNSRTDLFDFTDNDDVGQPDVVDLFHEI